MGRYENIATPFTDGIFDRGFALDAARAYVVRCELDRDYENTLSDAEREADKMSAADFVAFIDLTHEGGCEAFLSDCAE